MKIDVEKGGKKCSDKENNARKGRKNLFHRKIDVRKGSARLHNTEIKVGMRAQSSRQGDYPPRPLTPPGMLSHRAVSSNGVILHNLMVSV